MRRSLRGPGTGTDATSATVSSSATATATAEDEVLIRVLRGVWPCLPALLCASTAVCAATAATVVLVPGVTPVSVLVGGLLAGPFIAALTGVFDRIAAGGEATVRSWLTDLRALWLFGVRQALLAAAPVAVFLTALSVWTQTGSVLVLPSVGVSGACGVCVLLGLPVTLVLGAARRDLRGCLLWMCGLHLVTVSPLRFLAAPALAVLGVWCATRWSASVLLLVPVPVTAVAVAAVWTTAVRLGYLGPLTRDGGATV